ncbi:unnamed protein product [Mesocestoides corti]|uniref:Uncharacterized protein n=1 Tax=Mesocestoides corti TaxID=53468 RepID=A0A0R3UGS2_MESCO|nr:unnamed protein product [Mesocestoides corti]
MSSLSGDRGESRKPSRRRRGRGFCIFHPDAVTAKTISRLSKGVARLSANDDTTNAPDAPEPSVKQGEKAQICWSKASNSSIELPGDTSSSFGLYTQRIIRFFDAVAHSTKVPTYRQLITNCVKF